MSEGQAVPGSLYIYAPNKIAPVVFAVAFAAVGTSHAWQCRRYGDWLLTVLHPVCCFMFTVGFALREYGAFNYLYTTANLNIYIASTCLIYMAPPLLELANFHVLGRILYFVPYAAPLHPGRVLTTFGFLSSMVEVLNAIGVSYLANRSLPEKLTKLGDALLKAGLVLQIAVIALFVLCTGVFHQRCARAGVTRNRRVSVPLWIMYLSTVLILVRTIYRTVEQFGFDALTKSEEGAEPSPIFRYEWFFWVFEATLMLVNSCMWTVFHPRRYLPVNNRIYLERDGVTETEGPGWKDERPTWVTFLDPFGCLTLHRSKQQKVRKEDDRAMANGVRGN